MGCLGISHGRPGPIGRDAFDSSRSINCDRELSGFMGGEGHVLALLSVPGQFTDAAHLIGLGLDINAPDYRRPNMSCSSFSSIFRPETMATLSPSTG